MDGQSVLLLKPVLNVFTGPDDALLEVSVQSGSQGLLLLGGQEAGSALVDVTRVTEASESLFAVALDQSVDGDPVVPGHLEDLRYGASFCEEGEELGSAAFDGTGTGPVEMPEGVSVMRERGGQRYVFDALIIIYLIGVRMSVAGTVVRVCRWRFETRACRARNSCVRFRRLKPSWLRSCCRVGR